MPQPDPQGFRRSLFLYRRAGMAEIGDFAVKFMIGIRSKR
ncbi:cysteine methyltransferase, partial [Neisseria gonorrhoeae]